MSAASDDGFGLRDHRDMPTNDSSLFFAVFQQRLLQLDVQTVQINPQPDSGFLHGVSAHAAAAGRRLHAAHSLLRMHGHCQPQPDSAGCGRERRPGMTCFRLSSALCRTCAPEAVPLLPLAPHELALAPHKLIM